MKANRILREIASFLHLPYFPVEQKKRGHPATPDSLSFALAPFPAPTNPTTNSAFECVSVPYGEPVPPPLSARYRAVLQPQVHSPSSLRHCIAHPRRLLP